MSEELLFNPELLKTSPPIDAKSPERPNFSRNAFNYEDLALNKIRESKKVGDFESVEAWRDIHDGLVAIADGLPETGLKLIDRGNKRILEKKKK